MQFRRSLAALPHGRSLILAAFLLAFIAAYPAAYRLFGVGAAGLCVGPAIVAGYLYGVWGGVIAGILVLPVGVAELALTGRTETLPMLRTFGPPVVLALIAIGGVVGRQRDLGQTVRAQGSRYQELFDNSHDIIFTYDLDCALTSINNAGQVLLGWSSEELVGLDPAQVIPADHWDGVRSLLADALAGRLDSRAREIEWMTRDGSRVVLEISALLLREAGRPVGIQGIARDVTERRRAESDLRHQALHDNLTGLANRVLMSDRLEQSLKLARRSGSPLGVLVMDLSDFKGVNDGFGHSVGDAVLREVATRLAGALRASDTVARMGGDEFCFVLAPLDCREAASATADRLLEALETPISMGGQRISIGAHVGIATFPKDGDDAASLLRRADVALYGAKRSGQPRAYYSAEDDHLDPKRLAFRAELKDALGAEGLVLHYQPKVSLDTGRVVGVEALVRWQHPQLGLLGPDRFIALAEETGLIDELTRMVLRQALTAQAAWARQGHDLPVAVNLSPRQLHDRSVVDLLHELGAGEELSGRLELELTETAVMTDAKRGMELLDEIAALGIRLSIDDFGTGYSSFNRLHRLPFAEIKIDRSFVSEMVRREEDLTIVRTMIDLGHNLGLSVVAEGVEDLETRDALRGLGCDTAQGYLISRPLPADQLRRWLATASGPVEIAAAR